MHTQVDDRPHDRLGETGDPLESSIRQRLGEVSGTQLGPGHPARMVAGFYRLKKAPWTIVMFASGDKILQPIIRFRNYFFAGWAVFTLLLLAIIRLNVFRIVVPIRTLSKSAEAVSQDRYGEPIASRSHDEISQLINSYNQMVEGLKERDLIRNTFGRYVDPKVARKLLSQPEFTNIGGTKREVVILMADIRGFTSLAEDLEPDAVIRLLKHYFSFMIDITHRHDGIIIDFIGDGLLVFFEPLEEAIEETACRAYQCAHDMQMQMTALNKILQQEKLPGIMIGIGLNSGEVIVGNIGSNRRTKYGIVGAEVNLTQRIQAEAGSREIIVTESLFRHMACRLKIIRKFHAKVKGIQTPAQLYVVDEPATEPPMASGKK
jgi:class 3 adenylate cyclase